MDTLIPVFALIGAVLVAALPIVVWLGKKYIDKAIGFRFDRLKAEHEIRFGWQHEQVMKVATEIHEALVEAIQTLGSVAASAYKIDTGPTEDDIRRVTEPVGRFLQAFAKNSMFLPKPVRERVDKVATNLRFALPLVNEAATFRKAGLTDMMSKMMVGAADLFAAEIYPAGQALEADFRKLLLGDDWGE